MKGADTVSREGSPYMTYFVVFLHCPLVTKPNIAADNKNVYRVQLQEYKVGQIRVDLEMKDELIS